MSWTPTTANSESCSYIARLLRAVLKAQPRLAAIFPGKFSRDNGVSPVKPDGTLTTAGETWSAALRGLTARQLGDGLAACILKGLEWAPGPAKFRALCLGLPSLAQVEQELRPGQDCSPLAVLVRLLMDLHAFNVADGYQQSRMVVAAYGQALEHVSGGGALPAAAPALVHERPEAPCVSNRQSAAAMARAAQELGFD